MFPKWIDGRQRRRTTVISYPGCRQSVCPSVRLLLSLSSFGCFVIADHIDPLRVGTGNDGLWSCQFACPGADLLVCLFPSMCDGRCLVVVPLAAGSAGGSGDSVFCGQQMQQKRQPRAVTAAGRPTSLPASALQCRRKDAEDAIKSRRE